MSTSTWWRGLPGWLKGVYLFVAVPAWLFMVYCVVTGQNKSTGALVAFGIFATAAVVFIVFDRRQGGARHEASGADFYGGDS